MALGGTTTVGGTATVSDDVNGGGDEESSEEDEGAASSPYSMVADAAVHGRGSSPCPPNTHGSLVMTMIPPPDRYCIFLLFFLSSLLYLSFFILFYFLFILFIFYKGKGQFLSNTQIEPILFWKYRFRTGSRQISPILFSFFDPILPRFINVCILILMLL